MKNKNNENYFTKNSNFKLIGAAMVGLGFLLYFVGWGWIAYILMCVCIPLGAVLFIIGSSGRSSDEDIDEFIAVKMRELDPGLDTDKKYSSRIVKGIEPVELEGYEYREGLMFQKIKSGGVRSSEITRSVIYILADGIYVVSRTVSLISDEGREDVVRELSFEEIEKAEITEESKSFNFGKNLFRVKDLRLKVTAVSGDEFSIPVHDDLRSENITELINRRIGK